MVGRIYFLLRPFRAILSTMETVNRLDGFRRGVEISALCVIICTPAAFFLMGEHSIPLKTLITLGGLGAGIFALGACRRNRPRIGLISLLPGIFMGTVTLLWFSAIVVTVVSHKLAFIMAILDGLVLVALFLKSRHIGWGLMIAAPMLWVAMHVLFASGGWLYLSAPTDRASCEALDNQTGASWFSRGTPLGYKTHNVRHGLKENMPHFFGVDLETKLPFQAMNKPQITERVQTNMWRIDQIIVRDAIRGNIQVKLLHEHLLYPNRPIRFRHNFKPICFIIPGLRPTLTARTVYANATMDRLYL